MPADPQRIQSIFLAALEAADPTDRAAVLDRECGDDAELRQRVEVLLHAHDQSGSFLNKPAVQPVTTDEPAGQWIDRDAPLVLAERPGMRVGRYKLLQQIGEGGFGVVYMAEQQEPVRRMVALKIIKPGMDSDAVVARFEAERQALALMDHQNIARVFDGGTTESGRPFFVMELVKGIPMTRFCDENRLTPRERLELFVSVCEAVQHAHQKGIIHRDLKPSNVLVTLYDGKPVPKVIDFGVAKALHQKLTERTMFTAFGAVVGTLEYMSPEQAEMNALDVDTRSDVYSLGVLLYELLTGTTPLERERLRKAAYTEMLRLIREEEPLRPSMRISGSGQALARISAQRKTEPAQLARLVRGELDWIVMKALEKDRGRRYETATGLARDVERYLKDEPVEACPPSVGYRLGKFARKNRVVLSTAAAFAALLFLVIGLIVYGAWWSDRQSAERRHEQTLITARNNDAFRATLDQVKTALKSGRIAEAGALLGQVARQIDDQTIADLRERHDQLKKDELTLRELNDIFEERWNDIFEERWIVSPLDTRIDSERAKRRYPPLFRGYGLAVGEEPTTTTIAKIRQSVIEDVLSSSMTEWFFVDPKYPGLLPLVDQLDPNPARSALRGAIARNETKVIEELGGKIDGSQLSAAYAVGVGMHPAIKDRLRLLKAAWKAHPDSFPLALTIGSNEDDNRNAVAWGRTAVALRPNNPLAHYYYAVALSSPGRRDGSTTDDAANAVEELRRTIELAPRFAKAHGLLAWVLYFRQRGIRGDEDDAKALAAARTAIELDDQNILGHFIVYLNFLRDQKAYRDAAREARKLYKLFETVGITGQPSERYAEAFGLGFFESSKSTLVQGLLDTGRPFEAYRAILDIGPNNPPEYWFIVDKEPSDSGYYLAARAAAMAGTAQGMDPPPPVEQPAIRKRALEWLKKGLEHWKREAAALPVFSAISVSLLGTPSGGGSLLLLAPAAALPGSPYSLVNSPTDREVIHKGMNHWLSAPDLARVREGAWLDKLPADEREQWREFWKKVRSLRDQTAPATTAPLPIRK